MPLFHSRAALSAPLLALTLLGGCVDSPELIAPTGDLSANMSADQALGSVILVTNLSGGTEVGSLRWAVAQAEAGDVIRFDAGLAGQTITLEQTAQTDRPITIEGPAAKGITISGGKQVRVFAFNHPDTVRLRNMTIRDGRGDAIFGGGGIRSTGALRLEHVTVTANEAEAAGAMFVSGLTMVNSTVSGNTSTSTMNDFPVVMGGSQHIYINSTIAYNSPIGASGNLLKLRNTIISNNAVKNCTAPGQLATWDGVNIADDDSCGGPAVMLIADPKLEPLADNGGPNWTHAFEPPSPAFDAGEDCTVAVDQRYVARVGNCDVGAFEFIDRTTIHLTIDASPTVNPNTGWAVVTGTIRCSRNETFDLAVELKQGQKAGRTQTTVQAEAVAPVTCTTSARPWSIALAPVTGAFQNGGAEVAVRTVNTPGWAIPAAAARQVKMFWGHK